MSTLKEWRPPPMNIAMRPSTPLTRIYREIVVAGDYDADPGAVAETLVERLLAGRSI